MRGSTGTVRRSKGGERATLNIGVRIWQIPQVAGTGGVVDHLVDHEFIHKRVDQPWQLVVYEILQAKSWPGDSRVYRQAVVLVSRD